MRHTTRPLALLTSLLLCVGVLVPGALASEEAAVPAEPAPVQTEPLPAREEAETPVVPAEPEPAANGDMQINTVTIGGGAPKAGDRAEAFDPSIRFSADTPGCHIESAGLVHWYYYRVMLNDPNFQFTQGKEYHFTMSIGTDAGVSFSQGVAVNFADPRLRGEIKSRTAGSLTVEVYAAMDGEFDPEKDTVKAVHLTGFTQPREGALPDRDVTVLFNNTNDTAALSWYDAEHGNDPVSGTLRAGTYLLTIRLSTMSGFQFDRNTAVYLDGIKCDKVLTRYDEGFGDAGFDKEYGRYGYLEARFTFSVSARTRIGTVGLRGLQVYAGDSAGLLYTSALSCGVGSYGFYDRSLQWRTAAGAAFSGVFEAGKQYVLDVRYHIYDTASYAFDENPAAYIDGMPFADYDADILKRTDEDVTVRYTVTARARPEVIDRVELTLPVPAAGRLPAYTVETGVGTALYETDPVFWYPGGQSGYLQPGQRFEAGTVYRVTVWLAAAEGFCFAVDGRLDPAVTAYVNGQQAKVTRAYEQSADEVIEISYTFPPCASVFPGDADRNGKPDAFDAAIVLQYSAGLSPVRPIDFDAADMNGDERIDEIDAAQILGLIKD